MLDIRHWLDFNSSAKLKCQVGLSLAQGTGEHGHYDYFMVQCVVEIQAKGLISKPCFR